MARPRNANSVDNTTADDDLGQLVRWSLENTVSKAEPPAEVWLRIRERVSERAAPAAPQRARRRLPVASLVQAVVISSLVLAFGFGVERDIVVPSRQAAAVATPVVKSVFSRDVPNDVLSGRVLRQMRRELASNGRVGGYAR
jgi:hypothetical protein